MSERHIRHETTIVGTGETTYCKRAQAPEPELVLGLQAIERTAKDAIHETTMAHIRLFGSDGRT